MRPGHPLAAVSLILESSCRARAGVATSISLINLSPMCVYKVQWGSAACVWLLAPPSAFYRHYPGGISKQTTVSFQ